MVIIIIVRDAYCYLNLAEATKIRLHAEFNNLQSLYGGVFQKEDKSRLFKN